MTFYNISNLVRSRILYVFSCMSCDLTLEQLKPTNVRKRELTFSKTVSRCSLGNKPSVFV